MEDDSEMQRLLAESRLETERLRAIQKRKKNADLIIGISSLLVIIGLILVFATSVFDIIMPQSSVNQRAIAVVSIIPFSFGVHAIYTGVVLNSTPSLFINKNDNPNQYKIFTFLWFGLALLMLYFSF